MASNNLAIGALALLKAGVDPKVPCAGSGETAYQIAQSARALDVVRVLANFLKK